MKEEIKRYFNWPGRILLFSDPHFGDTVCLKCERANFENIESHNQFILDRINEQITENDTLVCLGDLGRDWFQYFSKIKKCGKKILILGNHDIRSDIVESIFDEVYDGPLFINKYVVVSHEPIPVSEHFINLHGHLHNANMDDKRHINLNIAIQNYELFDLDSLNEKYENMPKIRARFLREWYADDYVFLKQNYQAFMYQDSMHIIPKEIRKEMIDKLLENHRTELMYVNRYINSKESKEPNYLSTDSTEELCNKLDIGFEEWRNSNDNGRNG